MIFAPQIRRGPDRARRIQAASSTRLQRKCACGGTPGPTGECEECGAKKRLGLQTKLKVNTPGDVYEPGSGPYGGTGHATT